MTDAEFAVPLVSLIGRSNSGKTTLLARLIGILRRRGYRVGVIKHTRREDVETDVPGTDTRRLWDAGAAHVAFLTPDRVVHTHRWAAPPQLADALPGLHGVDLVLVEGYKWGDLPKIEVVRAARDPHLIPEVQGRVACVTDVEHLPCEGPCFGYEDVAGLADFIETLV